MSKLRFAVFAFGCLAASMAHAQATRTWVSGVGDDANPCSRTAPCKTFAGAISKTAAHGEINALDPGGFGGVTITKSITIDGGPGIAGILVSGTNAIVINTASTDTVVLRNLDINGVTTGLSGIRFMNAGHLHVENVRVHDFTRFGIEFVPTISSNLTLNNVSIHTNGLAGVTLSPVGAANAVGTIANSTVSHNYRGIKVSDGGAAAVRNSSLANNQSDGIAAISAAGTPRIARATVDNTLLSGNAVAGVNAIGGLASVVLSHSTVTFNQTGITKSGGGQVFSFGTNRLIENTAGDGTFSNTFAEE